jgi:hypothetical protein
VLYFGADSLAEDKLGCFSVTTQANGPCVQFLRKQSIPLILLGGGELHCQERYAYVDVRDGVSVGIENEIDPYFPWHDYQLEVSGGNM